MVRSRVGKFPLIKKWFIVKNIKDATKTRNPITEQKINNFNFGYTIGHHLKYVSKAPNFEGLKGNEY
ncbi:hypothetical protein BpHYR1_048021 [Brachionus plicatilis]|uniref:Uncharacterized protein n=1 Tax=Brachionus plicatilis TaxID=10195 RepID=A0A3M7TA31_BRAPC|nr:hypothetical protein BpHYR1_048021 [Brachionus plicatilis]